VSEDLTDLDVDELTVGKICTAAHTDARTVHDDLVGLGDLGEVPSLRARLLSRLAIRATALGAVLDGRV